MTVALQCMALPRMFMTIFAAKMDFFFNPSSLSKWMKSTSSWGTNTGFRRIVVISARRWASRTSIGRTITA